MNAEGTLKVLRDVTVQRGAGSEFVAICSEPAAAGDLLTLERIADDATLIARVCVIDSCPIVVSGSVRHRLRLKVLNDGTGRAAGKSNSTEP